MGSERREADGYDQSGAIPAGAPPDLKSETWTKDYNEIKELSERDSSKRTV